MADTHRIVIVGGGFGGLYAAQALKHVPVSVTLIDKRKFHRQLLKPGATLKTFRTFAAVHHGDYFETLRDYRDVMVGQGIRFDAAPDSAFQPIWCAWGFGRKIKPIQVYNVLPIVKKLGFARVTLRV